MDYTELAAEFLENLFILFKSRNQKKIFDSMQGELFVLQCIASHNNDVLPGEISNIMNISSARVAAALNNLESKELITRRIDARDRRRILVGLTQTGEDLICKHQQAVVGDIVRMLSSLGEQDAAEIVRIIGRLAEKVSEHTDP